MARRPLLGLVLLQWAAMAIIGVIWFNQSMTKEAVQLGVVQHDKDKSMTTSSTTITTTSSAIEDLLSKNNGSLHEAIAQRHRGRANNMGGGPCDPKQLLRPKALIGMIHVQALPGTPYNRKPIGEIVEIARNEAAQLESWGVDAIMIENMHDRPYLPSDKIGPEIVSGMTAVGLAVRSAIKIPLGIQVLAAGNKHAIAIAQTIDAQFIRAENFVFAHVADEGLMPNAEAPELIRYRRTIGAESVCVITDVKKKHSAHAITADVGVGITAEAAVFFGSDGVILTGMATGDPTDPADVREVRGMFNKMREHERRPIWIGSGVTPENLKNVYDDADAFVVGSYLKKDGWWENGPDKDRTQALVRALAKLRA